MPRLRMASTPRNACGRGMPRPYQSRTPDCDSVAWYVIRPRQKRLGFVPDTFMTNKLPVIFALLLILLQATLANAQSVTYQVTFEGKWTTAVTPGGLPSGAHFSPLIGAVHNNQVTFWSSGGTASAGIESMAEIGGTSALRREIASAGPNAHVTLQKTVSSGGTGSATIEFTATPAHPLVTLVTMVAPSPDWFVGISGLSLREGDNWLAAKTVNLYPYDAGTENGTQFSLSNPSTSPQGVITSIRGTGKFTNEPIATVSFTLLTPPPQPDPEPDPDPGGDDPAPVPLDAAAAREHRFPLFADGDGFHSRLFLNNVSAPGNRCALELQGEGLDAALFEEHVALTASDAGIEIDIDAVGAGVALTTAGNSGLSFGSAKLTCVHPAVARMLLVLEGGGAPVAMTTLESVRERQAFHFPVLPRSGRLGLVLANGNALDAACAVELETADGTSVGGSDLTVPAQSTVFRFLDELISAQDDMAGGAASLTCSRAVGPLGMLLNGGVFTALAPIDPEDRDESQPYRALLPLMLDGGGFQSRLLVTNLSNEVNRCALRLRGAGMNMARFENAEGVTREDSGGATLELAADGGRISLSSFGRHTLAFGHAALDCDAPAEARNLLTLHIPEGLAGMAVVAPAQFAREVRFPVVPRLGRLALVLSNDAESDASCEAALAMPGREETVSATTAIRVAGASTTVRFLADLFELPVDFVGGEARLLCDREIAAVSLPFAGAAFAAMPPTVPGFNTAP